VLPGNHNPERQSIMKLSNVQMTAAVRAYAAKHGYSIATVRTTSALRYAACAAFTASYVAPPAAAFIVSNAEAARLMDIQRAAGWQDEISEALLCECGELADDEMAEVVRNGRHVLVHVNGCMRDGDLLA
jgi:hypothetical protein